MVAFQEIQDTLNRIEDSLDQPLDIQALADAAHLSPYYFQRLFNRLVGWPIAEYQKQRRLNRALIFLRETDKRILDIALETGFTSHETFIRAFKSAFDMTPNEARKLDRKASGFTPVLMPDVTMQYKLIDFEVPLVADGLVLEISRRVYPQERLFTGFRINCASGAPNNLNPGAVWNYLDDKHWRTIPNLHPQGCHAGLPGPRTDGQAGYSYFAGAQVTKHDNDFISTRDWPGFGNLPEYLEPACVSIPSGEYIVCTFTAENFSELVTEGFDRSHQYFYKTFLPEHGLKTDGPTIDIYDERSLRWHPYYRPQDDIPHFAHCEPKLSQWEGPEMELQIKIREE